MLAGIRASGIWGIVSGSLWLVYAVVRLVEMLLLQSPLAGNWIRYVTLVLYVLCAGGYYLFFRVTSARWSALYLGLTLLGSALFIFEVTQLGHVVRNYATSAMPIRPSQIVYPLSIMALGAAAWKTFDCPRIFGVLLFSFAFSWLILAPFSQQPAILTHMAFVADAMGMVASVSLAVWAIVAGRNRRQAGSDYTPSP
ncbi:hypothetical protein J5O04_04120 [Corynebacterium hindlerae]|uniref:hypothetical protein n=1 Tax=Corynebacterium hindlerae TaxID=699041 RepID=UPI001AD72354|nr:hypothetical protein [Corynebacterium hindlerae]QTH60318.1 hypothetical protein J5O04_04120 [Corynebacterium hindlerae]